MTDFLPTAYECRSDLWETLADTKKPIVLYGMGNGADKILAALEQCGATAADFFASDNFVRGQAFHGKTVLTYAQVCDKYEDFIILLSFGSSLPPVLEPIYRLAEEREFYIPDVPVSGDTLFTRKFYENNYEKFHEAYDLLADEESKRLFGELIRYKLSGKVEHLRRAVSAPDCEKHLLAFKHYQVFVDAGAYVGDTARKFITDCPHAKRIYAIEPDWRSFKKLAAYAESETAAEVIPCQFCAWSAAGSTAFSAVGNRNSAANPSGNKTVLLNTVDSLGADADYIKYDVEGAEKEALLGSVKTIEQHKPDLLISAYHNNDDLFALPLWLHERFPFYKLYLRRFESLPAWDINLYAVK